MADEDGPIVAEEFYKELFKEQPVDPSRAAYCLHAAVERLRTQTNSVARWGTFIHVGA